MLVDLAHESFHEDDFREADREVSKVARKGVHVVEVVQLHGVREIQRQVLHVGTSAHQSKHVVSNCIYIKSILCD